MKLNSKQVADKLQAFTMTVNNTSTYLNCVSESVEEDRRYSLNTSTNEKKLKSYCAKVTESAAASTLHVSGNINKFTVVAESSIGEFERVVETCKTEDEVLNAIKRLFPKNDCSDTVRKLRDLFIAEPELLKLHCAKLSDFGYDSIPDFLWMLQSCVDAKRLLSLNTHTAETYMRVDIEGASWLHIARAFGYSTFFGHGMSSLLSMLSRLDIRYNTNYSTYGARTNIVTMFFNLKRKSPKASPALPQEANRESKSE